MDKRKFIIWLLALCVILIPKVSIASEESDALYQKIKDKGTLIVGLSASYVPNEFHATVAGEDEIVGTDISLAKYIANKLGVKLEIKEMGFDALLGAMKTGKVDVIISGMSPTPERLQEVDFSDPYQKVEQKILVRKENKNSWSTVNDFKDVRVGVQKESTQEEIAQKELLGANLVSLQKVTDLILNLSNKKVDAVVVESPVAEAYAAQSDDLTMINIDFADGVSSQAVAIPKNAPVLKEKINQAIHEVKEKGLMDKYLKEVSKHISTKESFFKKYGSYYLKGTFYTIIIAVIGVVFGTVLGCILALMKLANSIISKSIANIYIEFIRGTPLLVQIFLIYFGSTVLHLDLSALVAGCIALSVNCGAYVAEIIRGGIQSVDKGQTEAARCLGFPQKHAMCYVVLPQAVKSILPSLGNQFITVIKDSSIVSVIGVSELMFEAGVVQGASFKPFLPIVIASIIYFVLTFTLSQIMGITERSLGASD